MKKKRAVVVETYKHRLGHLQILKGKQWRWRTRGNNNEILATSENFKNRKDMLDNLELMVQIGKGGLRKIKKK